MGAWKDFIKAFSVGTKHYSLLELKNILGAVSTAQKLVVLGALFALIISAIVVLGQVSDASLIGPNLAICFLSAFYAVIIELLLLPLHLNVEREMNREMDFEDE
jgi:flagellar motor component MotA